MTKNNKKKKKFEYKPLKIPDNDKDFLNRGFFAYGIFKEGQIAYSKIKEFVNEPLTSDGEINRTMLLRDGAPLITDVVSNDLTKGNKIHFLKGKEEEAYDAICKTQPERLYKWSIVEIDKDYYNVLIGTNTNGSSLHCDDNGNYLDNFDGRNDPYFSDLISFIRSELRTLKYDDNTMFKLQMYFMILWSAIERYCTLKYDVSDRQGDYLDALSNDQIFINVLQNTKLKRKAPIFSAKTGFPFYFNTNKADFVIKYYYTLRSNAVHRGKDRKIKEGLLKESLEELLILFEKLIYETFK